ncbi:MAG: GNAT family N-acetyltransferase [Longimicrobiales bacterium]
MTYTVRPLGDGHDVSGFTCGNASLDEWLKGHARAATRQGTRTHVMVEGEGGSVVGYFAVAPHLIERDAMPKKLGRGAPRQIPAILLAKLAIDRRAQGQGLGSELLVFALEHIVAAARVAGGKVVVVDAIDEGAAGFYRRHDFEPLPGNPSRLVQKLSTVAAALGLDWP